MKLQSLLALILLSLPALPSYAESSCSECLNGVRTELKKCMGNAISADDKVACLDDQVAQEQACSDSLCKVEREETARKDETPATPPRPGLAPYIPSEGEWLALIVRAGLRREATGDSPYSLDVVLVGPETLEIVVRHHPTVRRESVQKTIDAARETIRNTARSYGWDKWVKIREYVEMYPAK